MYLYYDPTLTIGLVTRYQSWYGCYLSGGADWRCSHGFLHHGGFIHHHLVVFLSDSWDFWDLWELDSEWTKLIFLDLLKSLLFELLLGFERVGVGSADAKEVSPEEWDGGSEEEGPNDEWFLGLLVVALVWGSDGNIFVLVAPEKVAGVPDTKGAWWVDHELAWNEKLRSGWICIWCTFFYYHSEQRCRMKPRLLREVLEGVLVYGCAGNLWFVPGRWLSSVFGGQCFFWKFVKFLINGLIFKLISIFKRGWKGS